jgi:alkanesulfonate monooxygenase SsuD/methylene tetrahydromethanopterin reductase-like flavin-dependent oxidoreductase (luciferase family)
MDVGICVGAQISDIDYIVLAEELGYDSVWVADSQMIWSDCYATLALAAARTKRIKLGTGVAVAGTRIAPVTASAIASINQIAPGRVFLGLGTGHTAMRTMGHDQMGLREFKHYAQVVRDLLDGKMTKWTHNGQTQDVTLMHQGKGYYALEPRIPIHISGFGPQTQRWAGAWADSLVLAGGRPETMAAAARNVREGAAAAGRTLTRDFEISTLINSIVLEPGESLESERAIEETGSLVSSGLHYAWEMAREPKRDLSNAPPLYADVWQEYCDYIDAMPLPAGAKYIGVHEGHCSWLLDAERKYITPPRIRASNLWGTPDQIVEQIDALERAGLTRLLLLPPVPVQRKVIMDFAEKVMPLLAKRSASRA